MPTELHPIDVDTLTRRFTGNMRRCQALLEAVENIRTDPRISSVVDDMVRSVVVLLHATLEDLLRTVLSIHYRRAPESLNLQSRNVAVSAAKIWLDLLEKNREFRDDPENEEMRSMSIDEYIESVIARTLSRKSYTDTDQIGGFLTETGLEIPDREKRAYLADISSLMARRHRIVHNADLDPAEALLPNSIDQQDVDRWLTSILEFGNTLLGKLSSAEFYRELRESQ